MPRGGRSILLLLAVGILVGCSRKPAIEIAVAEIEPYEAAEGTPGRAEIKIHHPNYAAIVDGDRVLLRAPTATLIITYPLHNPATFEVAPDSLGNAYTLRGLVHAIAARYAAVYKEEAATATSMPGKSPGLENRGESNGKYGIWGHELEDLVLEHITIRRDVVSDRVLTELHVGS
jgi:hypothetical protein